MAAEKERKIMAKIMKEIGELHANQTDLSVIKDEQTLDQIAENAWDFDGLNSMQSVVEPRDDFQKELGLKDVDFDWKESGKFRSVFIESFIKTIKKRKGWK